MKMLLLFDLDDTLFDCTRQLKRETQGEDMKSIVPFPGVKAFLSSFPGIKVLVTRETDKGLQNRKIDVLGVREFFDEILICSDNEGKKKLFRQVQKRFPADEIAVIGDRVDVEIRYAKELGMKAIRIRQGKYGNIAPSSPAEIPDFEIENFAELSGILQNIFPTMQTTTMQGTGGKTMGGKLP